MTATLTPLQIKSIARETIESSWPVILTTVSPEGLPMSRAMTNLHGTDRQQSHSLFFAEQGAWNIFFRAGRSSEKIKHIHHSPRASVYFCTVAKMAGLELIGYIEVINDPHTKKILWRDEWECFFYGKDDPEYRILKFHTETLRMFVRLPDEGFVKIKMSIKDL